MPVFESTEKMYDVLGTLFRALADDSVAGPKYRQSGIVIKFTITDPDGFIWLTKDAEVICGPADLKPTIEMKLSGDTCHEFWLQSISMPVAMAKGRIKAKGPLPKVIKLLPLLKPAYKAYPEIAKKHGIQV
jgi:hypothetical protein